MKDKEELAALRQEIKRLRAAIAGLTPDLACLLKRRGLTIYSSEPADDLVLPGSFCLDTFYEKMKKYSFRLFLRDVIKYQEQFTVKQIARYATTEVVENYINYLLENGLVERGRNEGFRLVRGPIRSFGATLEWFLAEIFKREFSTEAIWGIKFKKLKAGGDYDLIAKINGSILYMEVKSSPPKQVCDREIAAFLNRLEDLNPGIAIFLAHS